MQILFCTAEIIDYCKLLLIIVEIEKGNLIRVSRHIRKRRLNFISHVTIIQNIVNYL